eukprot:gene8488-13103_t
MPAHDGLAVYDLYRRIPLDFTAGTTQGGFLSVGCISVMSLLFFMETWHYLAPPIVSEITLDTNRDPKIRINFNITLLDMPCQWVTVDVKDRLGVNRVDVVQDVKKFQHTQQQLLHNLDEHVEPVRHSVKWNDQGMSEMIEAMNADNDSPHLDEAGFAATLQDKKFVFVDFYAPWCIWCKRLAPSWEKLAKKVHDEHYHVAVRKVDCVANARICQKQGIRAFPTLRIFKEGRAMSDYDGNREIDSLLEWAALFTGEDPSTHDANITGVNTEHVACTVAGVLRVNRVPGNFHLQVKPSIHSINSSDTNVSHIIHHLSYGDAIPPSVVSRLQKPDRELLSPLDSKRFVTEEPRVTFDHYIKVLTTTYNLGWTQAMGYQIQHSNHQYLFEEQHADDDEGKVPEARFSYEFSPTAVVIRYGGRRWYEFVTNLCAIIGGVFTVMGLIDRSLHGMRDKFFK